MSNSKKITIIFMLSLILLAIFFIFKPAETFFDLITKQFVEGTSSGKTLFLLLYISFFSATTVFFSENTNTIKKLQKHSLFAFKIVIVTGLVAIFLGLFIQLLVQYSINAEQGSYIATITTQDTVTNWEMSYFEHNHITKSAVFLLLSTLFMDFKNFDTGQPFYENIPGIFFWDMALLFLVLSFLVSSFAFINSKLHVVSLFDYFLWTLTTAIFTIAFFDGGLFSYPFSLAVGLITLFIVKNFEFNKKLSLLNKPLMKLIAPFLSTAIVYLIGYFIANTNLMTAFIFSAPIIGLFTGYSFIFDKKTTTNNTHDKTTKYLTIFAIAILLCSVISFTSSLIYSSNGLEVKNTTLFAYGFPKGTTEQSLFDVLKPFPVKDIKLNGWLASIQVSSTKSVNLKKIEQALEEKFKPQGYLDVMEREKIYGKLNYSVFSIIPNQQKFTLKQNPLIFGNEDYTIVWTTLKPNNLTEKIGNTIFGAKINSINDKDPLKTTINVNMKGSPTWGLIAIATHINNIVENQRFLLWVNPKNTLGSIGDVNE